MVLPAYCTREMVTAVLDAAPSAAVHATIDRLCGTASRDVDTLCRRRFYPELATRMFSWPTRSTGTAYRLWLDQNELISVTTVSSGGVTIPPADYFLEPQATGPPYRRFELDRNSSSTFTGASTPQRAISILGLWGYRDDSATAGAAAGSLTSSATTLPVTDSTLVGVGDLIRIDDERMVVTGKAMLTTAQTLQAPVAALDSATALSVTTGSAYAVGETLLLDTERVRVVDVAGNTLAVRRAVDGSTLAAHTAPTIYAPRTLTVVRASVGTTAATHLTAAPITRLVVPDPVRDLSVAEVVVRLGREESGFARTIGSGEGVRAAPGGDLADVRAAVRAGYGRKARMRRV